MSTLLWIYIIISAIVWITNFVASCVAMMSIRVLESCINIKNSYAVDILCVIIDATYVTALWPLFLLRKIIRK